MSISSGVLATSGVSCAQFTCWPLRRRGKFARRRPPGRRAVREQELHGDDDPPSFQPVAQQTGEQRFGKIIPTPPRRSARGGDHVVRAQQLAELHGEFVGGRRQPGRAGLLVNQGFHAGMPRPVAFTCSMRMRARRSSPETNSGAATRQKPSFPAMRQRRQVVGHAPLGPRKAAKRKTGPSAASRREAGSRPRRPCPELIRRHSAECSSETVPRLADCLGQLRGQFPQRERGRSNEPLSTRRVRG